MEWIGTGFVLTIGGMRLRVRIALEDTPDPCTPPWSAPAGSARDAAPAASPQPHQPDHASSMN